MAGTPPDARDALIGRRIGACRKAAGLTQKAAGHLIGVSATQVQKYESGTNHISARHLHTFSQHFAVPLATFFEGLPQGPVAAGGLGEGRQAPYAADNGWADLLGAIVRLGGSLDPATRSHLRDALTSAGERLREAEAPRRRPRGARAAAS